MDDYIKYESGSGLRLKRVATELKVGISTIVDYLAKNGYQIDKNPNTKINEEQYNLLRIVFETKQESNSIDNPRNKDVDTAYTSILQQEGKDVDDNSEHDKFQKNNLEMETFSNQLSEREMDSCNQTESNTPTPVCPLTHEPEFIETAFPKLEGPKLISRIDIDSFNVDRTEKVGDIMQVKVINIRDYGAFVQGYNGQSGLILNKELSWDYVTNAADCVTLGDTFDAKITNILKNGNFAFSRKDLLPIKVGDNLSGIIIEQKTFGFIIKFGGFTSVLLNKECHPSYYEVGDIVKCVVTDIFFDEVNHRNKIFISERKIHEVFSKEHEVGEHITCIVEKIRKDDNGKSFLLVSYENMRCVIPEKRLIEPYCEELQKGEIQKGHEIEVVFKSYYEKTATAILDMRPILKEKIVEFSSTHSFGDHVICKIDDVREINGTKYLLVSYEGITCLVPANYLIEPYKTNMLNNTIVVGEPIELVYVDYQENTGIISLDMRPILKEREMEKINALRSTLSKGDILEAEVVSVNDREAIVRLIESNIIVNLPKYELSPNKVLNAADEVFEKEHIIVQYIGEDARELRFSRRYIVEDKYDDELYKMDVDQLLATMDIHTHHFVGKVVNINDNYFLWNPMSVSEDGDFEGGKLLVDPVNGKNLVAIFDNKLRNLIREGNFYKVELDASTSAYRRKQGTPYQFCIFSPNIEEVNNPYEEAVTLSFKKQTSPSANTSLANLLEEVGINLYSGKKRMFFELLQNADDAAAQNGVKVKIQLNGEYFTLTHDGFSFNKHDFDSIISAAKSTKSANKKKTGYKGIGFKSVFTSSTLVSIKSGGFHFSFDKSLDEYNDFSKFYFHVNDIESDPRKQEAFLKKYEKEAREFNGVKDIPWQLLPIWTDNMSIPLANSIFNKNENVAIALRMDEDTLKEYQDAVMSVLYDPRFMLFLRNTKRVQLVEEHKCLTIQKNVSKNRELVTLVNSFNPNNRVENYRMFSIEDIAVNDAAFEEAGVRIKREERINIRGEKEYYFVRTGQDGDATKEIPGVPDRIASATVTTISFALKLDDGKHVKPNDTEESSFYAYLPMNEGRFVFPFFVNADFIPNSDRERINSDNPWNHFLFYNLGKAIVKMVSTLASADEPEYLNLLCKKGLVSEGQDTNQLVTAFNKGYTDALLRCAFIINDACEKVFSSSIVYDNSELSETIGHEAFYQLIGTDKRLPNPNVDASILKNEMFGVEKISVVGVVKSLCDNISEVKKWIASADENTRNKFYEWIAQKKEAKQLIGIVPAYEFSDGWLSYSELTDKTIILSESMAPLKEELEKIGFHCSSCLYEDHPFHDYISIISNKKLFLKIKECDVSKWTFEERKKLFLKVVDFLKPENKDVGEWLIFKNQDNQYRPLSQMFQYAPGVPIWLNPYMVSQSEYCDEISEYVIASTDVFSKVVVPHIEEILTKIDIDLIYDKFSQYWSGSFTKQLFSKDIPLTHLLYIVEQSNDSKLEYIKHLDKLALFSDRSYEASSDEYRIIKIAATTDDAPSLLRNKILIDNVELNKYAVKDEVFIKVDEQRTCKFLLSELLPLYTSASQLSKVSDWFKDIPSVENIFAQHQISYIQVKNELTEYLKQNVASLQQFCFMMIATAVMDRKYTFDNTILYKLRYGNYPDGFVRVLDECYKLGIGKELGVFIRADYAGELFPAKIYGTYLGCDEYTLPHERVPEYIQQWATDSDKRLFLLDAGFHDSEYSEITRRKSFKEGKKENLWNIRETQIIENFFDWVKGTFSLPLTNENQVSILKDLIRIPIQNKSSSNMYMFEYDERDVTVGASEWTDGLYREWRKTNMLGIWITEKPIQYRVYYRQKDRVLYMAGDDDLVYFPSTKRVYISSANGRTPAVIMADVYSRNFGCPFTKDDWDKIFRISIDKYQELESKNETLKVEIERLRERLRNAEDDAEVRGHGRDIEKGTLSEKERIEINRDARYAAKEFLNRNEDFDCTLWDPDESKHLISGVIRYKGNPITVAVTSSVARKLYLHPRVFAELMQNPDNVLLNYGADKMIHSLSFDDIFSDNPNVNLIFDTDAVNPQRIAELANDFMGSRRTCFVVENPNYSQSDVIKHFGLNEKKSGHVNTSFTDDEIFDF